MRVANQDGSPEIFSSLQGEGRFAGEPVTFLRLSDCNLHCVWCDTPYTWNFDGTKYEHEDDKKFDKDEQQTRITTGEAIDILTGHQAKHIVITGGEPLLQQEAIVELCESIRMANGDYIADNDYRFSIETNGTIMPSEYLKYLIDNFTVSPKMGNSGNTLEKRYRPGVIETFARMEKADFKFVVGAPEDMEEIEQMIAAHHIPARRVFLMPEGRSADALYSKMSWLADLCIERGYRLSPRLQVEIWGDKRGV